MHYRCSIEIDVDADSPIEAARQVEDLLRNPEAMPWIVDVQDDLGVTSRVDLNEDPPLVTSPPMVTRLPKPVINYIPLKFKIFFGEGLAGLLADDIQVVATRPIDRETGLAGRGCGELQVRSIAAPKLLMDMFLRDYGDVAARNRQPPLRIELEDGGRFTPQYLLLLSLERVISNDEMAVYDSVSAYIDYDTASLLQEYLAKNG